MADESQLILEQDGDITIVGFSNPTLLDAYHVNESAKELYVLVEKQDRRRLVLDLSTIKMLSSQSLGVFLNVRHKLEELGGKIVISGIDPRLSRVFKITNLDNMFEFFPDTPSAIASLKEDTNQ